LFKIKNKNSWEAQRNGARNGHMTDVRPVFVGPQPGEVSYLGFKS